MSSFHITELQRALAEQHFGIATYCIDDDACTSEVAFALVDLLEQRQVRVKLSNSGYEVFSDKKTNSAGPDSRVFETLDDLLLDISPIYEERRAEELISKLSKLADTSS